MPRQPRIEYEQAFYHVMAWGDRREAIVRDDGDRAMFVDTMGQAAEKCGWKIYAWVLMDNHYHWVLRTPRPNLVAGMRWFQNTFTRRLNTRHKLWGHVFGGRYKAVLVEGQSQPTGTRSGEYLPVLMDYVHLNPARAGRVKAKAGMGLLAYPWSSLARGYGVGMGQRADWMAVAEGLEVFGWKDRVADRRKFVERLAQRAKEGRAGVGIAMEGQGLQSTLRRGWYWGSQRFREALLERVAGRKKAATKGSRTRRSSAVAKDEAERQAREWLKKGREHFGLADGPIVETGQGKRSQREGHRQRVMIAWALVRRTEMAQKWIAGELGLVSAGNVSQQVRRLEKALGDKSAQVALTKEMQRWRKLVDRR